MAARAIKRRGVFSGADRKEVLSLLSRADALINSRLDSEAMVELNEVVYRTAALGVRSAAQQALAALDDATDDDTEANNAWSVPGHVAYSAAYVKAPDRQSGAHFRARDEEQQIILRKAQEYI